MALKIGTMGTVSAGLSPLQEPSKSAESRHRAVLPEGTVGLEYLVGAISSPPGSFEVCSPGRGLSTPFEKSSGAVGAAGPSGLWERAPASRARLDAESLVLSSRTAARRRLDLGSNGRPSRAPVSEVFGVTGHAMA